MSEKHECILFYIERARQGQKCQRRQSKHFSKSGTCSENAQMIVCQINSDILFLSSPTVNWVFLLQPYTLSNGSTYHYQLTPPDLQSQTHCCGLRRWLEELPFRDSTAGSRLGHCGRMCCVTTYRLWHTHNRNEKKTMQSICRKFAHSFVLSILKKRSLLTP